MNTLADELVSIQTSQDAAPSMPSWFGARCSDRRVSTALRRVLTKICERVRGCRADAVCQDEVIDFLAVQIALRASSANADFQLSTRDCVTCQSVCPPWTGYGSKRTWTRYGSIS